MPSETEIAWLAGLLEGEGSFLIQRRGNWRSQIWVSIQMSDKDVIERALQVFPSTNKLSYRDRTKQKGDPGVGRDFRRWSGAYSTKWAGYQAEELMRLVRPYMGERRGAKIDELLATTNLSHHPKETA